MRLLMLTRKVDKDDALAGFTYTWVKKLGEKLDELDVICLEKGSIGGLPGNVHIYSLGKEAGAGRAKKFINFQRYAATLVPRSDGIFAHQNPIYTILIAPWAKAYRKKLVSWYTHKAVNVQLKLLAKLADVILTASPESFRLSSKKLVIIGHGIDTEKFVPKSYQLKAKSSKFRVLSLGRISPVKDYETLIRAAGALKRKGVTDVEFRIVGEPGLVEQTTYLETLKSLTNEEDVSEIITFAGSIPHEKTPEEYQTADLFLNLSETGSIDKAVLEAMSCGTIVLTSNEAFKEMFSKISPHQNKFGAGQASLLYLEKKSPKMLAERILELRALNEEVKEDLARRLREEVVVNHSLDRLMEKIIGAFTR